MAVQDCEKALALDPAYSKAYSRLGLAQFSLGNYEEAVAAYKKGLELDPNNAIMKQSLETAESHLQPNAAATTARSAPAAAAAAPGGMPDLGGLLNNPALMQMAGQMMQNPQMASMMQGLMGGAGGAGGSGGAPNLSELMNNPQLRNM